MKNKINLKNWKTEDELITFLSKGEDINQLFSCNRNALFTATYEKAILLIKYGINVFHKDLYGVNALMWNKDLEVCKLLIEKGLSIHDLDNQKQNAIFHATPEKTEYFYNLGININQVNQYHQNALLAGRLNKNKLLYLMEKDIDVNQIDANGENILFKSVSPDVISKALEKGANPNQINIYGRTPLFESNINKSKLLIKYGVNIHHTDENGENALFKAGYETSELLLDNGINFNVINNLGESVIFNQAHNIKKLVLLKEKGCNLNQVNKFGNSILWDAGKYTMKVKCFIILIDELGVDVNLINRKGENCTFICSAPQLKYLITKDVDCNLRNKLGFDLTLNAPTDKMKVIREDSNYQASESSFHCLVNRNCADKEVYEFFRMSVIAKGGLKNDEFEELMSMREKMNLVINKDEFKKQLKIAELEILKRNLNENVTNDIEKKKRL